MIIIKAKVYPYSLDLECGIDAAIKCLQRHKEDGLKDGYTDLYIQEDDEPYSDRRSLYLYGSRPETDTERDARLHVEAKRIKWQEERDRAEFLRLKEKFG